jgi:membrane protein DedA with SNARE-associated domain
MIAVATQAGAAGYAILYLGVAASWVGIPVVGAGVLAAAGVLASDGKLNIWLVFGVATAAAWSGGYVGYLLGLRAADVIVRGGGRWQRQRERAMAAGERIYRRWGYVAVFLTPTWVSGAMRMPRDAFLLWNAAAAVVSSCVAALGAYGVGAALLGEVAHRRGIIALAIAALAIMAVIVFLVRQRGNTHRPLPTGSEALPPDKRVKPDGLGGRWWPGRSRTRA